MTQKYDSMPSFAALGQVKKKEMLRNSGCAAERMLSGQVVVLLVGQVSLVSLKHKTTCDLGGAENN